jgi:hypothetical protein
VLDPARGAISGVGPLLAFELDVVAVRTGPEEVVLETEDAGAGGLDETVRVARIAVVDADDPDGDERLTAALDGRVLWTTRDFAVVACLAGFRARRVEFCADCVLAVIAEPACSATAFGVPPGRPCTLTTAAPTASAPPRAPTTPQDSESRRRESGDASQRRPARANPSWSAQYATPPYRLAAT